MSEEYTETRWRGRKVCFLGDSITDGIGTVKGQRYFDFLGEEMGFDAVGYGVNGARFHQLMQQISRMEEEQGDDVDAVFLLAGTNDFNGSVPIGDWYTETEETVVTSTDANGDPATKSIRKKREFVYDIRTFRGGINLVLSELKHRYGTKQIVLMTPVHRGYACFGPTNIQYPELYANALGLYVQSYVDVIREAADIWSCELIDLYRVSGLFPMWQESKVYFANPERDCLHPGPLGHRRLADVIRSKMQGIALF